MRHKTNLWNEATVDTQTLSRALVNAETTYGNYRMYMGQRQSAFRNESYLIQSQYVIEALNASGWFVVPASAVKEGE